MDDIFSLIERILWFFIVFDAVVLSHLLGRLIFAKTLQLSLKKFVLGIGSSVLWQAKVGSGQFLITRFPLGGSIRFFGENLGGEEDKEPVAGFLPRILALAGGPVFQVFTAMILLACSFVWYGDTSFTMQVVNTHEDSPARKAGFERGDVILRVAGEEVTRFEMGQGLIANHPKEEIPILVERRIGYRTFHELQDLMKYLDESYEGRNYIRIFTKGEEKPSTFYAREPALELLQKVDLRDLKVEISTARKQFEILVTPNELGRIGVGIKPYSLEEKTVYPATGKALILAFGYTKVLCQEFLLEVWNMIVNFFQLGNMPLELNVVLEIARFGLDFSELSGNELLKLISMLSIAVGLLNLFPLPRSAGFHILSLSLRQGVNLFSRTFFGKQGDVIDDEFENYLKWLYGAGFALILILFLFHSFPAITGS
ncbi:hypothetical protein HOF92_05005 [bacterium]|jgi:RIP metalloprotease RseP|nr:hypothetical protein [bacterium]